MNDVWKKNLRGISSLVCMTSPTRRKTFFRKRLDNKLATVYHMFKTNSTTSRLNVHSMEEGRYLGCKATNGAA